MQAAADRLKKTRGNSRLKFAPTRSRVASRLVFLVVFPNQFRPMVGPPVMRCHWRESNKHTGEVHRYLPTPSPPTSPPPSPPTPARPQQHQGRHRAASSPPSDHELRLGCSRPLLRRRPVTMMWTRWLLHHATASHYEESPVAWWTPTSGATALATVVAAPAAPAPSGSGGGSSRRTSHGR